MPKAQAFTIRLEGDVLEGIDDLIARHHGVFFTPGFSAGKPPVMSRADMLRWCVSEGMPLVQAKIAELGKRKKRGA